VPTYVTDKGVLSTIMMKSHTSNSEKIHQKLGKCFELLLEKKYENNLQLSSIFLVIREIQIKSTDFYQKQEISNVRNSMDVTRILIHGENLNGQK
jgi:hypothetical protein